MNEAEREALRNKRRRRIRWTVAILVIIVIAFYAGVMFDHIGG